MWKVFLGVALIGILGIFLGFSMMISKTFGQEKPTGHVDYMVLKRTVDCLDYLSKVELSDRQLFSSENLGESHESFKGEISAFTDSQKPLKDSAKYFQTVLTEIDTNKPLFAEFQEKLQSNMILCIALIFVCVMLVIVGLSNTFTALAKYRNNTRHIS